MRTRWLSLVPLLASIALAGCPAATPPPATAEQQIENFVFAVTEDNWIMPHEEVLAPWLDASDAEAAGDAASERALAGFGYDWTPVVDTMTVMQGQGPLDSLLANGYAARPEITAQNFVGWGEAEYMWEADTTGAIPVARVKLLIVRIPSGVRIGSYAFADPMP